MSKLLPFKVLPESRGAQAAPDPLWSADNAADDNHGGAPIIVMMMGAISGCIIGFLVRGRAIESALLFFTAIASGILGWYAYRRSL
jgi:hypothetical protein